MSISPPRPSSPSLPLSQPLQVASSFPCDAHVADYQWLHFDDDVVEEMNPSQLVTNSAYVLFYRRRRLTPSNVINLTV